MTEAAACGDPLLRSTCTSDGPAAVDTTRHGDTLVAVRGLIAVIGLAALVFLAAACEAEGDPAPYPTIEITVVGPGGNEATLTVEVVHRPRERQQGLMFRQSLPEDRGMLFLYPADRTGGFWMKDTYIPLTIAYIDAEWRVLELRSGRPLDETVLEPSQPYRYVLEVNEGWFDRHGLNHGARLIVPEDQLPRPE